jgi:aspartyl/asparaginyl beta-hydroxylase (cupin superfamily)
VLHVLGVSDVTLQPLESSTTDTTATDIAHPLTALPVRTPLHEIRASVARGEWRALYLWKEGQAVPAHHALCPHTTAVIGQFVEHGEHVTSTAPIDQSPVMQGTGLGYVYVSLLQPGTVIQSHCGPTNLRLRVHLGLSCDDSYVWC